MSVEIKSVKKFSVPYFKGIRAGDKLISVNGNKIRDFLDYDFYTGTEDEKLLFEIEHKGKVKTVKINGAAEGITGLEFDSYLMDKQQRCQNNCIFCFIDQNPEGMRESIYFKDDDSRMSFLFGNYITLTNLKDEDIDRIIKMHISPVNISVHTMNKELRVKMMKNKNAGKCLDYIEKLAAAGIEINAQLVLCPGINDGKELEYSLTKLSEFYPAVQSIAAVPVGLTKHREGLCGLSSYTKETSARVIEIIDAFGEEFKKNHGTRLAYASDEFYLKAGKEMPENDYYEEYSQYDNGVGIWTLFNDEVSAAISVLDKNADIRRHVSVATGSSAYPLIKNICNKLTEIYPGLSADVYEIKNDFYGHTVTVAGLVTAGDIIAQLKTKPLHEALLIPDIMLMKESRLFLDNLSVSDVERELNVPVVTVVYNDGADLVRKIIG